MPQHYFLLLMPQQLHLPPPHKLSYPIVLPMLDISAQLLDLR
jgi:hypothetical protein